VNSLYKYAILYFLLFSLLLLGSSVLLFEHKIGFSQIEVLQYYLGDEASFMIAKSPLGLLKIILPHIFAFGLFMMVLLHFLVFTKQRNASQFIFIIYTAFASAFLELFSPFLILAGVNFFAYVKIASFFTMLGISLYVSYLLFSSIVKE
jgi:hypothetical protein